VLVLAGCATCPEDAYPIVAAWLDTPFSGDERHVRRLVKMDIAGRLSEIGTLAAADPEVHAAIAGHIAQENTTINLIASENTVSREIREAQGSVLSNKYAEAIPASGGTAAAGTWTPLRCWPSSAPRRFSARARQRPAALRQFRQHGGLFSVLQPGDTILAMSLDQGGHLTTAAR